MCSRVGDSSQFEGSRVPRTFTELLEKPELKFHGVQTPYVLKVLSFAVTILMSEKRVLRSLCYLPAARGQQTAHDSVQNRSEGFQERLCVRVFYRSSIKANALSRLGGTNG